MEIGKILGLALFLALAAAPPALYGQPLTANYLSAIDLAGQGKFSEAKTIFREIIAAEPYHRRAWRCLQIIEDLERREISKRTAAHLFKGFAYFYKNQFSGAVAEATLALQLNPRYPRVYNARGGFYFGWGRNNEALADYNLALQIDPRYAGAYYNRGCLYLKTEEYERAIADFDRALKHDPKFAAAFYNRGIAHFSKGEFLWALADFNRALEINPRLAEAHFNRGVVLEELSKEEEAAEAYKKFLHSASAAGGWEISYARKRLAVLEK